MDPPRSHPRWPHAIRRPCTARSRSLSPQRRALIDGRWPARCRLPRPLRAPAPRCRCRRFRARHPSSPYWITSGDPGCPPGWPSAAIRGHATAE
eukprot:4965829-Prymnesium_polylepis.1